MYEQIELEEEGGTLSGYMVSYTDNNYKNFLRSEIADENTYQKVVAFLEEKQFDEIIIIKNLNVDEEYRGQGIGRSLLDDALSQGQVAILIADKYETQEKDFVLEKFYEGSDFLTISQESAGPLMVYPSEIAVEIKEKITPPAKLKLR